MSYTPCRCCKSPLLPVGDDGLCAACFIAFKQFCRKLPWFELSPAKSRMSFERREVRTAYADWLVSSPR